MQLISIEMSMCAQGLVPEGGRQHINTQAGIWSTAKVISTWEQSLRIHIVVTAAAAAADPTHLSLDVNSSG